MDSPATSTWLASGMKRRAGTHRIANAWWTLILLTAIVAFLFVTAASFKGTFRSYVPVTLTSDRAGLVMETNADVMLRGVQVGRVSQIGGGKDRASLSLEIDPDQIRYIPANVRCPDQRHDRVRHQVRRARESAEPES